MGNIISTVGSALGDIAISETGATIKSKLAQQKSNILIDQQIEDFKIRYVKKYEEKSWFNDYYELISRDGFIEEIKSYYDTRNSYESIDQKCERLGERFLREKSEYNKYKKEISEATKFLVDELIRILWNNSSKEDQTAFDSHETRLKLNSMTDYLTTINPAKSSICNSREKSNVNDEASTASLRVLHRIPYMNCTFCEKQSKILEWMINGKNLKEALLCIASLEEKEGSKKRAIQLYSHVAQNYPEEIELNNQAGCLSMEIGNYIAAERFFNIVISNTEANKCNAYYNMAVLEYSKIIDELNYQAELSNYNTCLDYLNNALKVSPDDTDAMNFKAYILMISKQNMSEALNLYNRCLQIEDKYDYRLNLAIFYLINKDFKKAEEEANKLLELNAHDANDAILYGLLANIYGTYGVEKKNKSIEMFIKAYEISGDKNYLSVIPNLEDGLFISQIFLNGHIINIYDDHEYRELIKSRKRKVFI